MDETVASSRTGGRADARPRHAAWPKVHPSMGIMGVVDGAGSGDLELPLLLRPGMGQPVRQGGDSQTRRAQHCKTRRRR